LAAPWSLAQSDGQPGSPGVPTDAATPTPGGALIAEAARLADSGRLVEARALLNRVMVSEDLAPRLTDEERRQLAHVGRVVDGRMQSADPIEMSLQKGELAAAEGDLRLAERQATAVLGKAAASDAARERAQAILAGVNQRRQEMAPLIDGMLDQVVRDFDSGKVLAAKNGLAAVTRSGVSLTPAQERTVDQYQVLVLQMEQTRGASLRAEAADLALGMIQPGTVRRGDQVQPPPPPPPPAPGAQQPPAEAPPAQPPGGEDVVRAALIANAQKVLAEADMAFQEKRYEEARTKYNLSATTHANYLTADQVAHASRRLAEIQAIIGQPGGGLGEQVVRDISLQRQRATAEFENQLAQAERALTAGDTGRARELAAGARLTANSNAPVFGENENQEMQRKVADLFRRIDAETERRAQVEAQERERALIEQQKRSEITSRVDKERKINEAIDRIRALQQELKYEEALQVVDQVLFLDPINPAGLLLRDTLQDIVVYRKYHDLQRLKRSNSVLQRLDAEADMVPPRGIIDYPPDWPAKTFQRGEMSAYTESPEDRRVLSELNSRKVPIDFADNALGDVIDFIAQVTSVNIDPDWDSLASIGITRDTPVSLRLSQVPMRVVLDRVLQKASERAGGLQRANWAVNDGILMIASDEQLRKQTTLVIYNITDLLLEIPNFYDAPSLDLQSVLQQSAGTAAGGRAASPFRDGQAQQAGRDEMERRKRDRITQITQIIEQNVDFNGWRNNGGDTGMIQELNGSLIITNTPRNHREITGLLSKLREIRSMQINVETKFLLVNQDWFEAIGFDLDVVINANNNQVRAARANDPTIQAGDFFNFNPSQNGGNFMARRVVGQGTAAGVAPPGGLDATRVAQGVVNPRAWSPVGVGQGHLPLANSLVVGDFATGVSALAPALGIAGQFLDDVQVDFLILATQADRRTVQLTAPRLTFTNGQTSNIFVVTQQAFVSDLEPVVGDSAVGFDPTVAVVSEGVVMTVEGVISADRRYVTLNVDAGVSRIDGFATQAVTAVAGGQLVSSADTQSFIQLPTITVTRVRTTVTVPDEGTVLLGGQRLVTELEIETGVPVLSKIPIINRFFTTRLESKTEQTLLILIKPTVLIQTEEEEKNFPGLSDRVQSGGLGL
jgi:general secretion pathway protein D